MDIFTAALFVGIGFLISWLTIPLIIKNSVAPAQSLKNRKFHHTHKNPVPRFGGLALAIAFVAVAILIFYFFPNSDKARTRLTILFTSLAMFALGFVDDIRSLGAKRKLFGQILIAATAFYCGIQVTSFKNPLTQVVYNLGIFALPVTVLWLVAMTNLINLIDGIDGLAGGVALMLMLLLMYVGFGSELVFPILCAAGICGALLGFLYYNFPPAKIYLGDGGAYFLGFLIGLLSINNSHKGTIAAAMIAPIFALALPIIDVSLAIMRRGLRGLPIFRPDRKHIHHRLQEFGHSRRRTVLLLYGVSLLFLAVAFGVCLLAKNWLPLLFGGLFLGLLALAKSFRFSWDWFSVGKVVGNSLEMRKEVQYVLHLGRWLELEAERCESISSLWKDYKFMLRKLHFSKVELHLDGAVYLWRTSESAGANEKLFRVRHELHGEHGMVLQFWSRSEMCSEEQFELMSELMAEAWMKATARWQTLHEQPLQIEVEKNLSESQSDDGRTPAFRTSPVRLTSTSVK
jgi:UDP-GlcNAc:undecaprenyl-phosphate GlcNAc-1-phosphate transferase